MPRPPFQGSDAFFQYRIGRIHDAGIDIARYLEIEQIGPMLGTVESVGCGLVDRYGHRFRGGIGLIAGVNGERFEFHGLSFHGLSPA